MKTETLPSSPLALPAEAMRKSGIKPIIMGNKVPMYMQVAQTLRQRIRTGIYKTKEPIPSFRHLADEFGVSLFVVQRAMRVLEEDGVLTAHHGKAVTVDQTSAADKAAIVFGLIQPYANSMQMMVQHDAEQAFSERNNLLVIRTSGGDPAAERRIAEHLVRNGIRGLLVWQVDNSPNGPFFEELSQTIPVVLVDRLYDKTELPAVIHDMKEGGRDICQQFMDAQKCRRLLVLIESRQIRPYSDLMDGLRQRAAELKREKDITIERGAVIDLVQQIGVSNFSSVDPWAQRLEQMLTAGGYDGFFCPQSDFIDSVMVQTGLIARFPQLRIGTISNPDINIRTRQYYQSNILQWRVRYDKAMSLAGDLVQQWIFLRHRPKLLTTVPLEFLGPVSATANMGH